MVERRLTDGKRIAQLLASEVTGHGGPFADVAVTAADPTVDPTADGALGYALERAGERIGEAYVHPDRVRLEFLAGRAAAASAADRRGLRARPRGGASPRTLVFLEDGAAVKRAVGVLEAALSAIDGGAQGDGGDSVEDDHHNGRQRRR